MKYRIQVDLDFNEKVDADTFVESIKKIKSKLYLPTPEQIKERMDLYTSNRIKIIKDYDDGGKNVGGKTMEYISLKEL